MTFELPKLPYPYDALEPSISAQIMEIHHSKHHQTYVTNLNALLEKKAAFEKSGQLDQAIALQKGIQFNGGGHINHSLFWENLAPQGQGGEPAGELKAAINKHFGSLDGFKERMSTETAAVQGSGWGWLGYCGKTKSLVIATCQNQDPLSTQGLVPLLGIDIWEHAYYLQYKQVRPDYLKAIWDVINWKTVENRYNSAVK